MILRELQICGDRRASVNGGKYLLRTINAYIQDRCKRFFGCTNPRALRECKEDLIGIGTEM